MSSWSRGAAVSVVAVALLAVAALAGRVILAEPEPRAAPTRVTVKPPFPSAEPSFDLQLPLTTTEVTSGKQVTIEGTGPRQIAYTVADGAMVAVHLDCALCSGLLSFVSGDEPAPLYSGTGPWSGGYLFNTTPGDNQTLLRVDAVGRWIVTLTSARDLSPVTPPLTGRGPRVVAVDAPGSELTVTSSAGERLRVFVRSAPAGGVSGASTVPEMAPREAFGASVRLPLAGPVLVTIESKGDWTLAVDS